MKDIQGVVACLSLLCYYRKGNVIEEQMKSLGSSFDWSRNFFTLDEVIAVHKYKNNNSKNFSRKQHSVNLYLT